MYNYTPDNSSFLKIEIGKVKKVRNLLIGVFMLLFFICFGFFLYVFLDKWWLTSDKLTFSIGLFRFCVHYSSISGYYSAD